MMTQMTDAAADGGELTGEEKRQLAWLREIDEPHGL
jgi:hypothetical protein